MKVQLKVDVKLTYDYSCTSNYSLQCALLCGALDFYKQVLVTFTKH